MNCSKLRKAIKLCCYVSVCIINKDIRPNCAIFGVLGIEVCNHGKTRTAKAHLITKRLHYRNKSFFEKGWFDACTKEKKVHISLRGPHKQPKVDAVFFLYNLCIPILFHDFKGGYLDFPRFNRILKKIHISLKFI